MPKFRGGSDDWLDDEESSTKRRPEPKKQTQTSGRAEALPDTEANGTVAEVFPRLARVAFDDGRSALCAYRRSSVVGAQTEGTDARERSPVAVGDRVKAQVISGEDGVIEGVCQRDKTLKRPAPGRDPGNFHVIAANIDHLCVVVAAKNPDFSPGLVDRFLVAASAESMTPILVVNKSDLADAGTRPWAAYAQWGVQVFECSAKRGDGIAPIRERLKGRSVVFCGHSGVGKTSLLVALTGEQVGRVGEVSDATGKGRHTTTGALLLDGPEGSRWIDTPGVREFGLAGIAPESLKDHFPEFQGLACENAGCWHREEPGCRARELPRYASYRRILESLLNPDGAEE